MTFEEYQKRAITTGRAKHENNEFFHLILGLVGESGEIAEKVKKLVRDHDTNIAKLDKQDIAKELGDVLWYVASLANFLDISLEEIARNNIAKLADRQIRGAIRGKGDNR